MQDPRENLGRWMAAALLLAAALTLCFYHYDSGKIHDAAGARIAVLAAQMNAAGSWLAPPTFGVTPSITPPLYLWMVKIGSAFSAEVPTYAVRFPASACSFLIVLLVAGWLYMHVGRYGREDGEEPPQEGFGLLAGLMLVSMPLLFWAGRPATANSMFALFYLVAAFCWAEALEARRSFYSGWPWRRWMLLGYLAAGVGVLVGGPLILLMLWIPYMLAARSYRLHGLDWSHLAGAVIAAGLGALWPWLAIRAGAAPDAIWRDWLTMNLSGGVMLQWSTPIFLRNLLIGTLPWLLPALVMIVRVWRREDRSPTLVFWMWSLAANFVLLTALNGRSGSHPLPLAALVALMATDGLFRWNLEGGWARIWRVALRVALILSLPLAMLICGIISSNLGLALFIVITIAWAQWSIRARNQGITFTPWATTVRLVSIAVVVFIAMETTLLSDWLPRTRFHNETLAFYERVDNRLDDEPAQLYLLSDALDPLDALHLGEGLKRIGSLADLKVDPDKPTYLFARKDLTAVDKTPWLVPLTAMHGGCDEPPREVMMRVLPESERGEVHGPIDRLAKRLPYRMALLGNTGTRRGAQRDVADRLDDQDGRGMIDDVVLLGNNAHGPSMWNHMDLLRSFEEPYRKLLRNGVRFHAALGHEDQPYWMLQAYYPVFNMCGRRYYSTTLGAGLVDLFVLDSERLIASDGTVDTEQVEWLRRALASSKAPWKVVGLYRALLTDAEKGRSDEKMAQLLIPIFNQYKVDVVAWGENPWYERLELPQAHPIFLGLGWSGEVRDANFANGPMLQASDDNQPGFFFIDFTTNSMIYRAIDKHGKPIDMGHLSKGDATAEGGNPTEIDFSAAASDGAVTSASTENAATTATMKADAVTSTTTPATR